MGAAAADPRREFEAALGQLRGRLHRYCARMTGTAFDGEDVLQEALARAVQAFDQGTRPDNLEAWLMRIAHNAAIDFLRRRARQGAPSGASAEDQPDPEATPEDRQIAAASLRAFLALTLNERSCVILTDVLGYSNAEVVGMLQLTEAAVKASLHRGRARLREAAAALEDAPGPALSPAQKALWLAYVDRFNARDFEAIRDMLAEEVWLDMVARTRMQGPRQISDIYLRNYGRESDWSLRLGVVDGRPALLVHDPADPDAKLAYFVELTFSGGQVTKIRDYRYARYVTAGAEAHLLD